MVSSKKLTYWHNFMGPNYADHLSLRPAQRKNANVISMHETLRDGVSLLVCFVRLSFLRVRFLAAGVKITKEEAHLRSRVTAT